MINLKKKYILNDVEVSRFQFLRAQFALETALKNGENYEFSQKGENNGLIYVLTYQIKYGK